MNSSLYSTKNHSEWWNEVGSALHPLENEDCETFAKRVTEQAWKASRKILKSENAHIVLH